ncbi:MAG: hypothetical protein GY952_06295 [Rhodobacteraceae bacterium]|nr:hypothetical protein [Paracoccaceae bacterium]
MDNREFLTPEFMANDNIPEAVRSAAIANALASSAESRQSWLHKLPPSILVAIVGLIGGLGGFAADLIFKNMDADAQRERAQEESTLKAEAHLRDLEQQKLEFEFGILQELLFKGQEKDKAKTLWFLSDIGVLSLDEEALKRWSTDFLLGDSNAFTPPNLTPRLWSFSNVDGATKATLAATCDADGGVFESKMEPDGKSSVDCFLVNAK